MKITAVKGISLKCRCAPISDALSTSIGRQALLVKIETDADLYGIGEAFTYGASLAAMKILIEEHLGPMLIGRDAEMIEENWSMMYWRTLAHGRRGLIMGAISGIDIALWDILGKAAHKPVYKLLGACRDKIPSYASGGFYAPGKDLDGLKREIEGYVKRGYSDVKIKIGRNMDRPGPLHYMGNQENHVTVEEDFRRIEAAKTIIGNGRLAVDANASWDAETAISTGKELSRLGVCWLEEPIPFEDLQGLKRVTETLNDIQVIGCETQQGVGNFRTMVEAGALDIVQPDAGWAGGITECYKIGAMAKKTGRKISLHCFGSAILFAASLQLAAAMDNTEAIESEENPNPLKTDIVKNGFEVDEKMNFYVPQRDGLGIELDWTMLEKYIII